MAQPRERPTASCHFSTSVRRAASLICGSNTRSTQRAAATAAASAKKPVAMPANSAAPRAVVSSIAGRSTGRPSTSACICMRRSLAAAPPSTRSRGRAAPASCSIAETTSATESEIAWSAARAIWAAVVPRVMPTSNPRACGSQKGAPRPVSAGTSITPPVSATLRASGSMSLARPMMPRPSRSHPTSEPATNTEPSSM